MDIIEVDGKEIRVTVKTSARARKTVDLEFKSEETLVVSLPMNQEVNVEALLRKHRDLIERKYMEYLSKVKVLEGDVILYRGMPHLIKLEHRNDSNGIPVATEENSIVIRASEREKPYILLKKWMTKETRDLIEETTAKYSDQITETPVRVSVTDTQRWGYCRKNRSIVFNWQLIALPPRLAEFVILHEYVHLYYTNHQNGFHRKLSSIISDYKLREKELRQYIAIKPNFEFKEVGIPSQNTEIS